MTDILFKTDKYIFSYRVAGILIRDGKVLLQKIPGEPGFAFPGGHAELGETNEHTLQREFLEEINTRIQVGDLKWVGEIFFPWGDKPCHQICFFIRYRCAKMSEFLKRPGFRSRNISREEISRSSSTGSRSIRSTDNCSIHPKPKNT